MRALSLLSGAALSAAVLAACDSGVTEPPFLPEASPTPTEEATPVPEATSTAIATPTAAPETPAPTPESGGLDGFRAFAPLIDTAVAEGDASFFADRGVEDEMTCTGQEQLGPCMGQSPGTTFRGIPGAAWRSDAFGLFAPNEYAEMLQGWFANARPDLSDEYGTGGARLYAIAQWPNAGASQEFLAIATAILGTGPATEIQRQSRIFRFAHVDGQWRLTGEILAAVSMSAQDWLSGECSECYDQWERWEGTP